MAAMSHDKACHGFSSSLREIADVIGAPEARKLADHFGGVRWKIPKTARATHRFVPVIGIDAMTKLCAEFGGVDISITKPPADTLKHKILRTEGSVREVALKLGCTDRYVQMVRNGGLR
ncbi:MAG: hypothetical protein HQL40_15445 [Alphaproteobacteria bacterium]|nr:hypothetical protein [Alphaproteobacteria bacterium]